MSDSLRPRAGDTWPPCMDFDNPGPHRWTRKRCSGCGKLEPLDELPPDAITIEVVTLAWTLGGSNSLPELLRQIRGLVAKLEAPASPKEPRDGQ